MECVCRYNGFIINSLFDSYKQGDYLITVTILTLPCMHCASFGFCALTLMIQCCNVLPIWKQDQMA